MLLCMSGQPSLCGPHVSSTAERALSLLVMGALRGPSSWTRMPVQCAGKPAVSCEPSTAPVLGPSLLVHTPQCTNLATESCLPSSQNSTLQAAAAPKQQQGIAAAFSRQASRRSGAPAAPAGGGAVVLLGPPAAAAEAAAEACKSPHVGTAPARCSSRAAAAIARQRLQAPAAARASKGGEP